MKVDKDVPNLKLLFPKNEKTKINKQRYVKVLTSSRSEKNKALQNNCGPKKIVQCHTCHHIYNRTNKKENKIHIQIHYEHLKSHG